MIYSKLKKSQIILFSRLGNGSTNTRITAFSIVQEKVGAAISLIQSTATGDSFTINKNGIYFASYSEYNTGIVIPTLGITKNSQNLSTDISGDSDSNILSFINGISTSMFAFCSWTGHLKAGDVLRAHVSGVLHSGSNGNTGILGTQGVRFQITNVL